MTIPSCVYTVLSHQIDVFWGAMYVPSLMGQLDEATGLSEVCTDSATEG